MSLSEATDAELVQELSRRWECCVFAACKQGEVNAGGWGDREVRRKITDILATAVADGETIDEPIVGGPWDGFQEGVQQP